MECFSAGSFQTCSWNRRRFYSFGTGGHLSRAEGYDSKTVVGPFRAEHFVARRREQVGCVVVDVEGSSPQANLRPRYGFVVLPQIAVLVKGA